MRFSSMILALALVAPGAAQAGTFNLKATLALEPVLNTPFEISGSASGAMSVGGGIAQVPAGLFTLTSISTPVVPAQVGLDKVRLLNPGLAAGTLDAGQATSPLAVLGSVQAFVGANPSGTWSLGALGAGGTVMGTLLGIFPHVLSAQPWQLGTFVLSGPFAGFTQTLVGFDARTASGQGLVQFVSPASYDSLSGAPGPFPAGATLSLKYLAVGEPTGLALGAAALALAAWGPVRKRS